ncbi:MAG: hypothetical protein K0R24_96 [Gammaproteobacteria bacterium]|jgi:hypothetical protein|nr:hypothetical protein [Gammaproteobacteria bacterium]
MTENALEDEIVIDSENNLQTSRPFDRTSTLWSRILNAIGSFVGEGGGTLGSAFHLSPMLRLCPPFAYFCYAFAEFLRGICYLILLCVPSFTYSRSEIRSLSSLIIGAIAHFTVTACYVLTALVFLGVLGTPALGWVLAAVGTSMGWLKNDTGTEQCYTGLSVAIGMIILAVNAFVFSPILLPSLGMSYIAAVGYACMVPSFLKGVASAVEMIGYLGKKLYECSCKSKADENILTEELSSPPKSPRTRSHSLSSSRSSASSTDPTCYGKVWKAYIGHPGLGRPDGRPGFRIPVIF